MNGKQLADVAAALVVVRVADRQAVRHRAADGRVPLADARPVVLEDRVVRALVAEERRVGARAAAEAERRRGRQQHVGARVELAVAEADLVAVVQVVVALDEERLGRRQLVDALVWRRCRSRSCRSSKALIALRSRREHARDVAAGGLAAGVRAKRRERPRVVLLLEAAEREQPVLENRAAGPHAGVARC